MAGTTTTLIIEGSTFDGNKRQARAIDGRTGQAVVTLRDSNITGYNVAGLELNQKVKLVVIGSNISANTTGIAGFLTNEPGAFLSAGVSITGTTFEANGTGVKDIWTFFKMRNSILRNNQVGLEVIGNFAGLPGPGLVNLGTNGQVFQGETFPNDPGGNTFLGNSTTSVLCSAINPRTVLATGNTWNKNTQGADFNGQYQQGSSITSQSFNASGQNFKLNSGDNIKF